MLTEDDRFEIADARLRCGCGGDMEHGWHPDGSLEPGCHCHECGWRWNPTHDLSFEESYQAWRTYLADLADELRDPPC